MHDVRASFYKPLDNTWVSQISSVCDSLGYFLTQMHKKENVTETSYGAQAAVLQETSVLSETPQSKG